MKVLTCKTLLFCLALMPANSSLALNWVSSYLPSWVNKPVAWAAGYIKPFMPATVKDAQEKAIPIEKKLNAANALLEAVADIQKEKILPKYVALNEDLEWMDRTIVASDQRHAKQFLAHYNSLSKLQSSQEITSNNLKEATDQAEKLRKQFSEAVTSVTNMDAQFQKSHNELAIQVAALKVVADESIVQSNMLLQDKQNQINDFDKQIESNLGSMKQKIDSGDIVFEKAQATNLQNTEKLALVISKLEKITITFDSILKQKAEKRQAKVDRKKANTPSAMLEYESTLTRSPHTVKNLI